MYPALSNAMTKTDKILWRRRFKKFQQSREKLYAPSIARELMEQIKTFIYYYKREGDIAVLRIDSEGIIKVIRKLYLDAGVTYGAKIRAELHRLKREEKARMPIGFNERMVQLLKDYFRTDILNTSERITATTRELIQEVLQDAVTNGWGIDEIIKRLENTELSRMRARLIARTETVTAANKGAMFAAKDSGLKLNKIWLAANDNRTRRHHHEVDDHVVGIDDKFNVGGELMSQPGDRGEGAIKTSPKNICNCRCSIAFQPMRDSSGRLVRV